MDCPHCGNSVDGQLLLCPHDSCGLRIYADASLDTLKTDFSRQRSGAFLEIIRRAYQGETAYERERCWQFAYAPIRDFILQIFQYHRASRGIVTQLESIGYSRDDLVNEIFLRQLIKDEARQFNSVKALRAFLELRSSFALISILRANTNLPPKVLERFFRLQVISKRNEHCINQLLAILGDEAAYSSNLEKRGIKPASRQRKLKLRSLNLFLLRESIYELKKIRQIYSDMQGPEKDLLVNSYSLTGKSDNVQRKKLSDLKGDAMIELWSILLSDSITSNGCHDYKQYSLKIMTPYIESLDESLMSQ